MTPKTNMGLGETAVLVYDVPTECKGFYGALMSRIRGKAIPINKSVYLIPYGEKPTIERMVAQAEAQARKNAQKKGRAFTMTGINVDIVKFDGSSQAEIERILIRETDRLLDDLKSRVSAKVKELTDKGEAFDEKRQKYYLRRMNLLKEAFFLFGLSYDIEDACKTIRQIIGLESHQSLCI